MNVLRGVSCGLALFCLVGLTASLSGCSKKSPTGTAKTGDKSPVGKTDKTDDKPANAKTPDNNGQNLGAKDGNKDSGTKPDNGDPSPVKKKSDEVVDPPTVGKKESGSGTRRKLRGPKL